MKRHFLYLISISFILFSCKSNSKEYEVSLVNKTETVNSNGKIHNVSVADFQKALQLTDATLIDVRTLQEFEQGHIEGAINIDWYQRSFRNYIQHIRKDKPILIYCRSGNRTSKTSGVLQALGYSEIYNLERGIDQWVVEKAPVTRSGSKKNLDFQEKIKNAKTETVVATSSKGKIYNVSAGDFSKVVQLNNVTVVDIRTPQEFASGHIKNAKNIDWYQRSFRTLIQDIPKEKPIAIYCRSGNRTSKAANLLQSLGFKEVVNLNYGIVEWSRYNLPLEQ